MDQINRFVKISVLFSMLLTTATLAFSQASIDSTALEKHLKKQSIKRSVMAPAVLISAGLLTLEDDALEIFFESEHLIDRETVFEWRMRYAPNFRTHADDYLQYAPVGLVYGLNAMGVHGKNDFVNRTALLLKSELITLPFVGLMKKATRERRPNGNNLNAFPSGHTAQAFVSATFLHREYGHLSKWYSIGGYAAATATGALRVLNNKHWVSDVLVGAGIGILFTNLVYETHQYKWKWKSDNWSLVPTYQQSTVGLNFSYRIE